MSCAKKILLTGASGFIGRNIKESYLNELYDISSPSSSELNLTDINSVKNYFKNREFDVVLHCACKPGHRNAKDHNNLCETNLLMFENLVSLKDSYEKFINFGSGAIYDLSKNISNAQESDIYKSKGLDPHGKCKYLVHRRIDELQNFVDLNFFGVFGKYEDYAIRFISNAICKTLFQLPISLRQNRRFSYLWIEDLYPVLKFFIENKVDFNSYNIVSDENYELLELAELVKDVSGSNAEIILGKEGFGLDYTGSNKRLKSEFSDLKFTKIEDSVTKLYDWYKNNKNLINQELLLIDK